METYYSGDYIDYICNDCRMIIDIKNEAGVVVFGSTDIIVHRNIKRWKRLPELLLLLRKKKGIIQGGEGGFDCCIFMDRQREIKRKNYARKQTLNCFIEVLNAHLNEIYSREL